jgi:hypothetical protein
MRSYNIFICLLLPVLITCTDKTKKGKIAIKYETPAKAEDGVIVRNTDSLGSSRDTIVLRFLSGFSNDSAKICVNDKCNQYDNLKTDFSTAYASSAVIPQIRNAKQLEITLKGLTYSIPINKEYLYIDLDFDEQGTLTITYSNNVLLLSFFQKFSSVVERMTANNMGKLKEIEGM